MENKKYNHISDRITNISVLLDKSNVDSIVDYKNGDEALDNYLKSEDIKQDKPLKNIKLNYIISDEEYYIINVNKFITNFEDLEILDPYSENVLNLRDLSTSLYSDI